MSSGATLTLPIVRLRFTVQVDGPSLQLPPYAGSMLRGALGHALLALSPLPHPDGGPCALQASCPYCALFVAPPPPDHHLKKLSQMPHPYVVEPPTGNTHLRAGETFEFALVLIGKALAHEAIVTQAVEHALRTGLTDQHTRCTVIATKHDAADPYPPCGATPHAATLRVTTPLWLARLGRPIRQGSELDARTLLIALARRYQLLLDACHGPAAPQQDFSTLATQAAAITSRAPDMRWMSWGRYSQRQQREMHFGGLVGSVHLEGELAPFAPLLHLGQWLHLGKKATFGMGAYTLTWQ